MNKLMLCGFLSLTFLPTLHAQDKPAPVLETAYYPLKEGMRWTYQVTDNKAKEAMKKHQVVITVGERDVFKVNKEDPKLGKLSVPMPYVGFKLKIAGGGKTHEEQVVVLEDGVYKLMTAGKQIEPPLCFLKLGPPKDDAKKNEWQVDSQSENAVLKGRLWAEPEKVQVPAGVYDAIAVRCRDFQIGGQELNIDAWYAPNVGMVKQHVRIANHDVMLELERHEKSAK